MATETTRTIPVTCEYCGAANRRPAGSAVHGSCAACGAPLPARPAAVQATAVPLARKPALADFKPRPVDPDVHQAAAGADRLYNAALTTYSTFWRTLAEAVVIMVCAAAVGITGAVTGMPGWGVVSAVLIGVAVGLTSKWSLFTYLGAPIGLVLGAAVGAAFWALGAGPRPLVILMTLAAIAAAFIGGRVVPYPRRNWWEKARPFLGAAGGLAFGLLGMLLGLALRAAAAAVVG